MEFSEFVKFGSQVCDALLYKLGGLDTYFFPPVVPVSGYYLFQAHNLIRNSFERSQEEIIKWTNEVISSDRCLYNAAIDIKALNGNTAETIEPLLSAFAPVSHILFRKHLTKVVLTPANFIVFLLFILSLFIFLTARVGDNFFSKKTIGVFALYHLFVIASILFLSYLAFRYTRYIRQFFISRQIEIRTQLHFSLASHKKVAAEIAIINKDIRDIFKALSSKSLAEGKSATSDTLISVMRAHLRTNEIDKVEQLITLTPLAYLKQHAAQILDDSDFESLFKNKPEIRQLLQDSLFS